MIWLTTPTAATLLSEWRLNIIVSTAPSIMMSRVSINIGAASLASRFLSFPDVSFRMCLKSGDEKSRKGTEWEEKRD